MSNQIILDQIANKTTIGIKASGDTGYTVIVGAENINLPKQPFNGVEVALLNPTDGIKQRLKGSRSGGDLAFKVTLIDGDDAGLLKVLTAYEGDEEVSFEITYPSGAKRTIARAIVLTCDPADHTTDAVMAYDVSCAVNSKMVITEAVAG